MTVLGRPVIIIRKCKVTLWLCIPALFQRCIHINCSLFYLQPEPSTGFLSLYCSRGVKTSSCFCGIALNSITESMGLECLWHILFEVPICMYCLTQVIVPSTPCRLAPRCSVDRKHSASGSSGGLYSTCTGVHVNIHCE